MLGRFKLDQNDGVHCHQVLVYSDDDLEYWEGEAKRTGHITVLDKHIPENWAGQINEPHDIYQIFPPEVIDGVHLAKWADLTT